LQWTRGIAVLGLAVAVAPWVVLLSASARAQTTPRVKVEAQGWWMERDGDLTRTSHHGHLHAEALVPHQATVAGSFAIDLTVKLHDTPGVVRSISSILKHAAGKTHTGDQYGLDFRCDVPGHCERTFRVVLDTTAAPVDGLTDVLIRPVADTPGVAGLINMTATIQFTVNVQNGNPEPPFQYAEQLGGTGKYTEAGYASCVLSADDSRRLRVPKAGTWTPRLAHLSTGDAQSPGWNITRSFVSVDPNLHGGDLGRVLRDVVVNPIGEDSLDGARGEVAIDTTRLSNGVHKLLCLSQAKTNLSLERRSLTGVGVFFFEVRNP
jgi:hypothetical protein